MRILGIDYGSSKIGLALGDTESKTALPWKVLNPSDFWANLSQIITDENISKIVVGWPLNLSGEETKQTYVVKKFIEEVKQKTNLEVITIDERYTSIQANKLGKDDEVAAMNILQTYLDKNAATNIT